MGGVPKTLVSCSNHYNGNSLGLYPDLAFYLWPWTNYLSSWWPSYLICKMGLVIVMTSWDCVSKDKAFHALACLFTLPSSPLSSHHALTQVSSCCSLNTLGTFQPQDLGIGSSLWILFFQISTDISPPFSMHITSVRFTVFISGVFHLIVLDHR